MMGQKNRNKNSKKKQTSAVLHQRSSDIKNEQVKHVVPKSHKQYNIYHDVKNGSARSIVDASKRLSLKNSDPSRSLLEKPLSLGNSNNVQIVDVEENRRFSRKQLNEFRSEKASDDQRIKYLHSMNTLFEKTPQYMARCYLRNDLLSLGLLHGLKLCINTSNPSLRKQLERFFEGERRDNLQGDANDPRSAIDILWKWLNSYKDMEAKHQMLDLLDALSKCRALKASEWNKLITFVKHMSFNEDSPKLSKNDESKEAVRLGNSRVITESVNICSDDLVSLQNPYAPSASPAPSDPDHYQQEATTLSTPTTMALDNLTLLPNAPLPSIKLRPRSRSRLGIRKAITPQQRDHLEFSQDITPQIPIPRAPPPPPPGLLSRDIPSASPPNLFSCNSGPASQVIVPPPAPPPPPSNLFGNRSTSFHISSSSCSSPALQQNTHTSSPSFCQLSTVKSEEFYPKKKKTYTILWEAVNQHTIQNVHTVWNKYPRPEFTSDERDQLQSVFERQELAKYVMAKSRKNSKNELSFRLNQQKALNLEILLAKLRPLSFMDIIECLESSRFDGISVDLLSSLLKYFPTDDEMSLLKNVVREDLKRDYDLMCWELARRKPLKIRAELAIAKEKIVGELSQYAVAIESLKLAIKAFDLPVVTQMLHKCLQYGNYVNQGSPLAHAPGFAFNSLPSILAAKGKNEHSSTRVVDLLAHFVNFDLKDLEDTEVVLNSARSINLSEMEKLLKELSNAVNGLRKKIGNDEDLLDAYLPFIQETHSSCQQLTKQLESQWKAGTELQSFFCASNMMLEEMISSLADSLGMLSAAVKYRSIVKLRSKSLTPSRPFFGRNTPSRGSLRSSHQSVDEVRQIFINAFNQNEPAKFI